MQHVDEGQLHAYLDGELAETGLDEAAVEGHLTVCPACSAEMARVRALRDRGKSLLEGNVTFPLSQPPFSAVVARARGVRPAPAARRWAMTPLAWAASVMFALGAGWLARGVLMDGGQPEVAVRSEAPTPMAGEDAATTAPAPANPIEVALEASPEASGRSPEVAAESEATAAPELEMIAQAPPPAVSRQAPIETLSQARGSSALGSAAADEATWEQVDLARASGLLGTAVATVPELPVLSIEVGRSSGRLAIRVTQDLGGGRVLTLIEVPAPPAASPMVGAARAAAPRAASADASVRVSNLVITGTAPVGEAELRRLLERVR